MIPFKDFENICKCKKWDNVGLATAKYGNFESRSL